MRFLFSIFSYCLLFSFCSFLSPLLVSADSSATSGAVYSLSNDPTNNAVLVFSASAGGVLTYSGSVLTGGAGLNVSSGDSLHSQGSLVVGDNYLFAVNAGSNTLSQFAINPNNPTQVTFIAQAQTGFTTPVSASAWAGIVCTLNTGTSSGTSSGIGCFNYNAAGLTALPSWSRSISLGQTTASQISFSPDGKALIVSVKSTNGISIYPIINGQLSLTPSQYTPINSTSPFGFNFVGSNGIFVVDSANTQANVFGFNSVNGLSDAASVAPIALNTTLVKASCWSVGSANIGSSYVIGGGGGIVEVAVDPVSLTSSIVQYISTNGVGVLDSSIITLGGVDYLIGVSGTSKLFVIFALLAQGRAVPLTPVALPQGLTVQVQGLAYFVTGQSGSSASGSSGSNSGSGSGNAGASSGTTTPTAEGQTVININFQGLFQGLQL